jgi:methyl-accepting chemotaxis protein
MAHRTIRGKIFFVFSGAIVVFALGMAFFTQTIVRHRLAAILEEKGVAIGRRIAAECINPLITEHHFQIEMMFKDLQGTEKDLVYAYVLDDEGVERVATFPAGVPEALKRANPVPHAQGIAVKNLKTSQGPVLDIGLSLLNGNAGVLHLGFSEDAINEDVNRIVTLILLFTVLSLMVAGTVMIFFTRFVTRPLMTLTSAVEDFGRGEAVQSIAIHSEDEVGVLTRVFNQMVENRQQAETERENLIGELQQALNEIKTLRGILPICSSCKKIRTDQGSWQQLESYLRDHSDVEFSHGICPECTQRLYPEYWDNIRNKKP